MSTKRTDTALKERMSQWHAYVLGSAPAPVQDATTVMAAPVAPALMEEARTPAPPVHPREEQQVDLTPPPAQASLPPLPEIPLAPPPDPLPDPMAAATPPAASRAPAAKPPKPPAPKPRQRAASGPSSTPRQPPGPKSPAPAPGANLPALLPEQASAPPIDQAVVRPREGAGGAQDDRIALLEAAIAQTLERSRQYAQTQGADRPRPSRIPSSDGRGARILPALYPPSEPVETSDPWYSHAVVRAVACVAVLAAFAAFTAYVFLHRS